MKGYIKCFGTTGSDMLPNRQTGYQANGREDGYWFRPYVSEKEALDQAVQMADRFNRIFMRTLRQLRDLRRYAPVTINNPNQEYSNRGRAAAESVKWLGVPYS